MALSTAQYAALSGAAYSDFGSSFNPADPPAIADLRNDKKIFQYINDRTGQMSARYAALSSMNDWKLINFKQNIVTGFAAAAFQAPNNPDGTKGEIIFAFRGTEPTAQNGVDITGADVQIATQRVFKDSPAQLESIKSFVYGVLATNTGVPYSFTGHSLGGALAQYMKLFCNSIVNRTLLAYI